MVTDILGSAGRRGTMPGCGFQAPRADSPAARQSIPGRGTDKPDIHAIAMSSHLQAEDRPFAAAIHHDGTTLVDAVLADFAARQRLAGRRVLGLLMSHRESAADCTAARFLTDIDTGDEYLVSQPLGAGSNACSADPQGFAQASRVLRDALVSRPDLVISNRFGSLEAGNGGFAAELLALLSEGIPVLTVVSTRHLEAWRRFIGEAPMLTNDPRTWALWFDGVMLRRHALTTEAFAAAGGRWPARGAPGR